MSVCFLCREAFAVWIPPFGVPLSYGIAISYVLVDTIDKGAKAFQAANIELGANGELHPEVNCGRLAGNVLGWCCPLFDQRVPFQEYCRPAAWTAAV